MSNGEKLTGNDVSMPFAAWDDLETFVAGIEHLSYSAADRSTFFSRLSAGLQKLLRLNQIQVSLFQSGGSTILLRSIQPVNHRILTPNPTLFTAGESRVESDSSEDGLHWIVADHCLLPNEVLRVEAVLPPDQAKASRSVAEILGTCAVLAGNFLIRHRERDQQSELKLRRQIEEMISQLARAESSDQPASEICRIIQATLNVDRVSLLSTTRHRAKLLGTSAAAVISQRTRTIQLLQKITETASQLGQTFEFTVGSASAVSTEPYGTLLEEYVEETGVRVLRLIPIPAADAEPQSLIGYLFLEHFSADWPDAQQQFVLEQAQPHFVDSARRVLIQSQSTFLGRLKSKLADRKFFYSTVAGTLLLVLLLLWIVPKELKISAEGVLMPAERAVVFAPKQGVVEEIQVHHGEQVTTGETLFILRSPELAVEERRISGEMETLRRRLESLKAARIRNRVVESRRDNETDLSAEESDLETQLKGLAEQLALVQEQGTSLIVKSPLPGQVDRWDLNQALADRPVAHGQYLCDVLNVEGDWGIELQIPDDVVGYVLEAQSKSPCTVTYLFRTNSDRKYESRIAAISNSVQFDREGKPVVLARIPAVRDKDRPFRVGASVIAHVHCGNRSIGFVYLREVIEFLQRTFWF